MSSISIENNRERKRKINKLPVKIALNSAKSVGSQMVGFSRDFSRDSFHKKNAQDIFKILSEVKAGAMKFGQALSVFESAMPDDIAIFYREHLVKLQDSTPPIPFKVVIKVLEREFGREYLSLFKEIDELAVNAASIGQVHRGVFKDGSDVAIKIQYPGIKEAMESDLKQIEKFSLLFKYFFPNLDFKPIFAELKVSLLEEVNYLIEGEYQRVMYNSLRDVEGITIPKYVLGSERVLVSSWLEGRPLKEFFNINDQELRNRIGMNLVRFNFSSPERAHLLHSDPHPGNFKVNVNGDLEILDFGSCKVLKNGFPQPLKLLLRDALRGDGVGLYNKFRDYKFMLPERDVDPRELLNFLLPLVEALVEEEFSYSRDWLQSQSKRVGDPRNPTSKIGLSLNLPAEYLLIHRVTLGSTMLLSQLGAKGRFRDEARIWFPDIF